MTFYLFYIKGYITEKWVGGLFSNWKITLDFIKHIHQSKKVHSKRYQKYLYYLKNINNLKKNPIPDFLLVLNSNDDVIKESINLQIPILGLIDSNINPDNFLYKIFGNNDSIKNIYFFFNFLK
jgi:small subunit ribosomal protein S2